MRANNRHKRTPAKSVRGGGMPCIGLHSNCRIWIYSTGHAGVLGDGKIRILEAVDHFGSLREACYELAISYRKAWGDLKKAEACLGTKLVVTARGGACGGRTRLTQSGQKVIAAYRRMRNRVQTALQQSFDRFIKEIHL